MWPWCKRLLLRCILVPLAIAIAIDYVKEAKASLPGRIDEDSKDLAHQCYELVKMFNEEEQKSALQMLQALNSVRTSAVSTTGEASQHSSGCELELRHFKFRRRTDKRLQAWPDVAGSVRLLSYDHGKDEELVYEIPRGGGGGGGGELTRDSTCAPHPGHGLVEVVRLWVSANPLEYGFGCLVGDTDCIVRHLVAVARANSDALVPSTVTSGGRAVVVCVRHGDGMNLAFESSSKNYAQEYFPSKEEHNPDI